MSQKPTQKDRSAALSGLSTSRSLLVRVRADEPVAWKRLVTLYTPLVAFWCRKLDLPPQDVDDVLQDVFRAVAVNIGNFRRDRPGDTFRGWLRTITRSKVMDYYRHQADRPAAAGGTAAQRMLSQHPGMDVPHDDDSDEQPFRDAILQQAMAFIQSEFREGTWQAFWRVVVDGKTPTEVAQELNMKPGAVRVAKCRVLQRLRAELGELYE